MDMEKMIRQSELNVVRMSNGWVLVVEEEGNMKLFYYEKGNQKQLICKETVAA